MITQSPAEAVTDRLFEAMLATWDVASAFLGARMGYYEALAELGEVTPRQLADRVGANERYTREWLEQQAATGLIEVATASDDDNARTYRLIPGTEPVFTDGTGEQPILHFVRAVMASILPMPDVITAYRTGTGLPFGHYGEDMMIGQGMGNRWGFALLVAAFVGLSRFTDFQSQLGAPPGSIADRLSIFTANGVLVCADNRYRLTEKGRALFGVLVLALQWAQRWFRAPEGPAVIMTHTSCGARFGAVLACDQCTEPLTGAQVATVQSSRAMRNFGATWR